MLCDKIQDNLSAYIDGEAGPELAAEIERHVSECEQCRAMLGQLRKVAGLVGSMPQHAAPLTLAEDVQSRLERQMLMEAGGEPEPAAVQADRRLPQRRPAMWPRVAAVAACLVLVAGIAALLAPQGGLKTEYAAGPAAPVDRIAASKVNGPAKMDWDSATTPIARADEDKLGAVGKADSTDGQMQRSLRGRDPEFHSKIAAGAAGNVGRESLGMEYEAERYVTEKAHDERLLTDVEIARKNTNIDEASDAAWLAFEGRRTSGASENELFLVAADVESGERAVQDALVQAGVVNATLNRAVVTPARSSTFGFRSSQQPETTTAAKEGVATATEDAEVLEIVTIEARVAPSQAATLNLLVANSDALTVSEASNGVFAQAAQTQQLMRQVPAVARNRALADNRIVQSNLKMQMQRANLSQEMPRQVAGFQRRGEGRDEKRAAEAAIDQAVNKPAEEQAPAGNAPATPAVGQTAPASGDRPKELDGGRQQDLPVRLTEGASATNDDVTPASAAPEASPAPAAAPEPSAAPQVQTNEGTRMYREAAEAKQAGAASQAAAATTADGAGQTPAAAGVRGISQRAIPGDAAGQLEGGVVGAPAGEATLPIVIQLVVRRGPSQAAAAASVRDVSQKAATETERPEALREETQAAPSPLPSESGPREAPAQP